MQPPPPLDFSSATFPQYAPPAGGFAGVAAAEDAGHSVRLTGDTQVRVGVNYPMTDQTVLEFDLEIVTEGSRHGMGFDADTSYGNNARHDVRFELGGTSGFPVADTRVIEDFDPGTLGPVRVTIPVGQAVQQFAEFDLDSAGNLKYLTLFNRGAGAEMVLRNVRLYEADEVGLNQLEYAYNANDQRVAKEVYSGGTGVPPVETEYYVYDGSQLSMTFAGGTGVSPVLEHRYLYGPLVDQVLVDESFRFNPQEDRLLSDGVLWLYGDHQNTIRDVVDTNGVLRKHTDYDSFGNVVGAEFRDAAGNVVADSHAEAVDELFGFQGLAWDDDLQAYNNRARLYDPHTGRFWSEDPSGFSDGANLYRSRGNNPVNLTDPTGLYQAGNPLTTLWGGSNLGNPAVSLGGSPAKANPFATNRSSSVSPALLATTLGSATSKVASNLVSPQTRAAVGAGVAFAGGSNVLAPPILISGPTGIFDFFAGRSANLERREQEYQERAEQNFRHEAALGGLYGNRAFKQAEAQTYRQIFATPHYGTSLTGIGAGMARLENDTLQNVTGQTHDEAVLGLIKGTVSFFGRDPAVMPDEFYLYHRGRTLFDMAVSTASNPLTYAPLAGGLRQLSVARYTDDVLRTGDSLLDAYRGFPATSKTSLSDAPFDYAYRARLGIATSDDYASTFYAAHPQLQGQVVVHHAVEQQALTRYPTVVTKSEIHSLENLRGIPVQLNREIHLTKIRKEWNDFYRLNPSPTKPQLLQKATQIDFKYGKQFTPPVGRVGQ